jgi:hypothetical protein
MTNLQFLTLQAKHEIAIANDSENLKRLCAEILAAPILKEYRPRIYQMAEFMQIGPILTPCCNAMHIYCQCNAD